jgi:hypothetical protein
MIRLDLPGNPSAAHALGDSVPVSMPPPRASAHQHAVEVVDYRCQSLAEQLMHFAEAANQ